MKLNKSIFVLGFLLVFPFVAVFFSDIEISQADSKTIVVPEDYRSIQEAVNNALEGDVVLIKSGTYNGSVFVNKSISLIGEEKEKTTILGCARALITLVDTDSIPEFYLWIIFPRARALL